MCCGDEVRPVSIISESKNRNCVYFGEKWRNSRKMFSEGEGVLVQKRGAGKKKKALAKLLASA